MPRTLYLPFFFLLPLIKKEGKGSAAPDYGGQGGQVSLTLPTLSPLLFRGENKFLPGEFGFFEARVSLHLREFLASIMAEGIKGKNLEDLEKDITCPVCQEHYTESKILPCLHYYCKRCILKLALRTGTNKPFSCPECRKETTLPEGGVEELKTVFFVHRLKFMYFTVERVHGKVEVKCEGCTDSGDKAEAFCRQCAMFICKECEKSHKRMKVFASHEVDSLEDLKQGRAREIAVKEPPTMNCHVHEEPLIIYCFDCDTLICHHCTAKVHRDHNFEFSKIAAPDTKKNLLEELASLKQVTDNLLSAIEDIQSTKQEVKAQGDSVANTIHTSFNELHQILKKYKNELLQGASRKVQEKIDKLSELDKNLTLANTEVQGIVDYTERFVCHCSDNEVMSMQAEIRSRIQREVEEHGKSGRSIEPAEEADMGVKVRCAEALQQLCQTNANITRLALDPAQCTVKGEGVKTAELHQTAEVTLTTKLTNNKITRRSVVVASQLNSLYDGSVVKCEVDQSGPGEYRIEYTPTVRGRHELTVSVDGQQVAGSPFPVFVSIHPTQLGKPVKVWYDINSARGITTNSVGDVIVTEREGDIVKLESMGKKSVLVKHSKSKLIHLEGVSTDDEDNIYCTESQLNKVMKCNKRGGKVRVYGVKQGLYGLTVVGDEVMLCDRKTITVYDRELKYVRCIEHDMGDFMGLSADNRGNLYVSDSFNDCIQVFSNDGVFLHSFGSDSNGVKRLNIPYYVCVSGHYVYVTNIEIDCVVVFTTAGDYVISFGQEGSGEGEFCFPRGVCTDKDGFVYVADSLNNRVQCF